MRTSPFWAAAVANLGVEVPPAAARPVVTVITKKGRRAIENAADIADALRQRFIGVDVELLDGNSLNTISVKARVRPGPYTCGEVHTHICCGRKLKYKHHLVTLPTLLPVQG